MLSGWAYVKLATQQRIQTRTAMEIRPVLHVRLVPTQLPPLVFAMVHITRLTGSLVSCANQDIIILYLVLPMA